MYRSYRPMIITFLNTSNGRWSTPKVNRDMGLSNVQKVSNYGGRHQSSQRDGLLQRSEGLSPHLPCILRTNVPHVRKEADVLYIGLQPATAMVGMDLIYLHCGKMPTGHHQASHIDQLYTLCG